MDKDIIKLANLVWHLVEEIRMNDFHSEARLQLIKESLEDDFINKENREHTADL